MLLDRRQLGIPINFDTPTTVLIDVAPAHNVITDMAKLADPNYIYRLVTTIAKHEPVSVPIDPDLWTTSHLRAVAKYINSHEEWTFDALAKAFLHFVSFINTKRIPPSLPLTSSGWPYLGPSTVAQPYTLNASMVYALIVEAGIKVTREFTIEQMYNLLVAIKLPAKYLRQLISTDIQTSTNSKLLNYILINNLDYTPPRAPPITETTFKFAPVTELTPVVHSDPIKFISYAAAHGYDLTTLDHPTLEVFVEHRWEPTSEQAQRILAYDPFYFSLEHNFNDYFPAKYYKRIQLRKLATSYKKNISANPYVDLVKLINSDNFYHGPVSYSNLGQKLASTDTLQGEAVTSLNPATIVTFGTKRGTRHLTTYDELETFFETVGLPQNPFERGYRSLSENQLERLKYLANLYHHPRLASIITGFSENLALKILVVEYKNATTTKLKDVLFKLLRIALIARGWDEQSDYPLATNGPLAVGAHFDQDNLNQKALFLYAKTFDAIKEFSAADAELKRECRVGVSQAPIIKYLGFDDGANKSFVISTNPEEGLTIDGRLQMVLTSSGQKSCIRLTSNVILATYYTIMTELNFKPPFTFSSVKWMA